MIEQEFLASMARHLDACRDDQGDNVRIFPLFNRNIVGRVVAKAVGDSRQRNAIIWRALLKFADERRRLGVSRDALLDQVGLYRATITDALRSELAHRQGYEPGPAPSRRGPGGVA